MSVENLLLLAGRIAGVVGVLICVWAVVSRFTGGYYVGSFQTGTLLMGGMTAMLLACLCFLAVLIGRVRK